MVPLGGPAIIRLGFSISERSFARSLRPVTLRPYLSISLPFLRVRFLMIDPLSLLLAFIRPTEASRCVLR